MMKGLWAAKLSIAIGVLVSSGILTSTATSAATSVRGIELLGSTNEGGTGSPSGPRTGILDITAGPCSVLTTLETYEHMPSLITLLHGSAVVAKWRIFGEQRIAWVEPVGNYLIRSNQFPTSSRQSDKTRDRSIRVSTAKPAVVNLMPACK
jgi:hypothetical protein